MCGIPRRGRVVKKLDRSEAQKSLESGLANVELAELGQGEPLAAPFC